MQITSFEEFKNWAAENIKSYLPDSYSEAVVEMRRVEKPGAPYTGLTVMKKGQTAAANVNLELMYEMYTGGASAEEIMEGMAKIAVMKLPVWGDFSLQSYEDVKKRICIRLLSLSSNLRLAERVPHRIIEDMILTYNVISGYTGNDIWTSMIDNSIAESWGITEDDLYNDALRNSSVLFPPRLDLLTDIIGEKPEGEDPGIMVLSNKGGFYGASAVMYPGVLEMASSEMGGDFYIIPSSINEMILVPTRMVDDPARLLLTHRFASSNTAPAERLSERIFFYDCKAKQMRDAVPEMPS